MKISKRGRYGIRLLIDLAENCCGDHVTLLSAAIRQSISARYLEQVAIILRRAGFTRSIKGASGGYALAKPAEEIIIGDVLRALEGDMLIAEPPPDGCGKLQQCIWRKVFEPLNRRIAEIIDSETLASLIKNSKHSDEYMYFI
ncbi:MAG: Rrf2 family transcriptional regulator [Spirochaetaceae bacterium]|jgi:Rrf2 family protein|nr:Rrf2 family transcriptional regulator [Spirochaetaceae bacterium]